MPHRVGSAVVLVVIKSVPDVMGTREIPIRRRQLVAVDVVYIWFLRLHLCASRDRTLPWKVEPHSLKTAQTCLALGRSVKPDESSALAFSYPDFRHHILVGELSTGSIRFDPFASLLSKITAMLRFETSFFYRKELQIFASGCSSFAHLTKYSLTFKGFSRKWQKPPF